VLGKTKDEAGNRIRLKYDAPEDGGPVGPGVAARVKLKIRGDFAADMESIGLHDRDEERSAVELPISFVLDGQVFPCVGLFRIRSTEDKKAAAKLER